MPDLSQFGTPGDATQPPPATPPAAPPAAAPQAGGLSQFGTPDLSQFGTADAPQPADTRTRVPVHSMNDFLTNEKISFDDLKDAMNRQVTGGVALTAGKVLRAIPVVGDLLAKHTNLDANIADAQAAHDKPYPTDPSRAKDQEMYEHLENIAEYMTGEKAVGLGLTALQKLEMAAPIVKALKSSPIAAKLIGTAVKQAPVGYAQTRVHGGTPSEAVANALMSTAIGVGSEVPNAVNEKLGSIAQDVKPSERQMGNVKFTQLASEFKGPEGQPLASPAAQRAAQYSSEPALRYERQAAFKNLQTDLAKTGIRNALEASNQAMASSNVGSDIKAVPVPGPAGLGEPSTRTQWRYIPPDGSTSLTADETRSAMNEIKQRLLDKNWTQGEEQQLTQAYDDMKNQLDRHDEYTTAQAGEPHQPHDVDGIVNATTSYGDAANHLRAAARQQWSAAPPEMRRQYLALEARRNQLQTEFDQARDQPNKRDEIMRHIDDTVGQIDDLFNKGTGEVPQSPAAMRNATTLIRQSNAFQKLQNTMDQHFNLRADTAAQISRPRVAQNLNSLSDHIEQIRSQFGSVLDPALGKNGLNHIIELGDLMNQPEEAAAAKSYIGNIGTVVRRHYQGLRGLVQGTNATSGNVDAAAAAGHAGFLYLTHLLGHTVAGPVGSAAVLGADALHSMIVNRIATDPVYANKLIYASKNRLSQRLVGTLLAAHIIGNRIQAKQEPQPPSEKNNADSQ